MQWRIGPASTAAGSRIASMAAAMNCDSQLL
jgi:hypothetical protein